MLVFVHPRVLSRVSGFPVASPCLWGKLQNLSFSKVSKQVVMSFCVAGVALCDIPTCLTTCRCQTWRKSHTNCSFFCTHVSCLESLVFLWRRRVYGGSCKISPFRRFPSRLLCRFAWQAWHFLTFQLGLVTCRKCQNWRSRTNCSFFCAHVFRLESLVFLWRRRV